MRCLSYLRGRALDDQIHLWYVQTTSRHVRGHQHFEGAVPEAFQRDLSLFLSDVTVQRLAALQPTQTRHAHSVKSSTNAFKFSEDHCQDLFDGSVHGELCGFFLGLAEDDGPSVAAAVHLNYIAEDRGSLRPVTGDGQVLHAIKTHASDRTRNTKNCGAAFFYLDCGGGFLRFLPDEIHMYVLRSHVFLSHVINPRRTRG